MFFDSIVAWDSPKYKVGPKNTYKWVEISPKNHPFIFGNYWLRGPPRTIQSQPDPAGCRKTLRFVDPSPGLPK